MKEFAIRASGFQEMYRAMESGDVDTARIPSKVLDILHELRSQYLLSNSAYVATLYGAVSDFTSVGILMEFCNRGNLHERLVPEATRVRMTLGRRLRYAVQIAKGLRAVHKTRRSHRDMKSPNVFLKTTGRTRLGVVDTMAVIGDFGQTVVVDDGGERDDQIHGTMDWLPPEAAPGRKISGRIRSSELLQRDIFAMGQILGELWNEALPWEPEIAAMRRQERWQDLPKVDLVAELVNADPWRPPTLVRATGPVGRQFERLFARCVSRIPGDRPTAEEVVVELVAVQRRLDSMLRKLPSELRNQVEWDPFCCSAEHNLVDLVVDGEINSVPRDERRAVLARDWAEAKRR